MASNWNMLSKSNEKLTPDFNMDKDFHGKMETQFSAYCCFQDSWTRFIQGLLRSMR